MPNFELIQTTTLYTRVIISANNIDEIYDAYNDVNHPKYNELTNRIFQLELEQ